MDTNAANPWPGPEAPDDGGSMPMPYQETYGGAGDAPSPYLEEVTGAFSGAATGVLDEGGQELSAPEGPFPGFETIAEGAPPWIADPGLEGSPPPAGEGSGATESWAAPSGNPFTEASSLFSGVTEKAGVRSVPVDGGRLEQGSNGSTGHPQTQFVPEV